MSASEPCEKHDLIGCVDCHPPMRRARPADCTEGEDGPTITASMPGECVTCEGRIEVGDRITHIFDGWVHAVSEPGRNVVSFEGI